MTGSATLRERLAAGETLVGTFAKLAGADAGDVLAGAGFDFAIVDREHSQLSDGEARALVRTMRAAGLPALVRVPALDRGEVNRLLEAGAAGIQLSTVRSAAQARGLRQALRYAPVGARSISLAHAQADYGRLGLADYLAQSDGARAPLAVVQLETATTDDPAAEILKAGADVAFVGSTDLLVDVGLDAHAAAERTRAIVAAAGDAGLPWGGFAADSAAARAMAERGARYVVLGSDLALLGSACREAAAAVREAVGA
ncbi:MAG TPA: aldolase/citrate lyase family protein [Gaiellales bacterium]|nr:aldolase/citrate lyase family protein [Gaiellales bacterium]